MCAAIAAKYGYDSREEKRYDVKMTNISISLLLNPASDAWG
jgi:hypothetical protein